MSVGVGAGVWATTGSPLALPAAAAAGVLPDADHLLDYYNWFVRKDERRLLLVLHAWELVVIALALSLTVWRHPVFLAGAIGYFGHVAGDQLANRPTQPMIYFMLYRAYVGFDRARMFEKWPASVSESLHLKVPMWRHIEPRLLRLASMVRGKGRW